MDYSDYQHHLLTRKCQRNQIQSSAKHTEMPARWDECQHARSWVSINGKILQIQHLKLKLFSVNTKFHKLQDKSLIMKLETQNSTSSPRRMTFRVANSVSHLKFLTSTSSVSFQKSPRVRFRLAVNWLLINFLIYFQSIPDVRGMPQEVSVIVKKGVETKSYEGVSKIKLKSSENSNFFNLLIIKWTSLTLLIFSQW